MKRLLLVTSILFLSSNIFAFECTGCKILKSNIEIKNGSSGYIESKDNKEIISSSKAAPYNAHFTGGQQVTAMAYHEWSTVNNSGSVQTYYYDYLIRGNGDSSTHQQLWFQLVSNGHASDKAYSHITYTAPYGNSDIYASTIVGTVNSVESKTEGHAIMNVT